VKQFHLFAQTRFGFLVVLMVAAYLEVYGDSCFQEAIYQSSGLRRFAWFIAGTTVLAAYSLFLNSSRVDFGKLLGLYVVVFFVVAQLLALMKYGQRPTLATWVGGTCIAVGGLVLSLF
jgi:drug/metabolite transporter superfamily protein YnfA